MWRLLFTSFNNRGFFFSLSIRSIHAFLLKTVRKWNDLYLLWSFLIDIASESLESFFVYMTALLIPRATFQGRATLYIMYYEFYSINENRIST